MKMKRIVALLMIAIMVFALTACSGGGGGGSSKPSPVGKYTLSGMSENGEATSEEDLKLLESLGLTVTMEIKEDGTGVLDLFGETMDFTWDDDNLIVDGEKQAYTFDGTTFTMESDETSMTFTKNAE